MVILSSCVKVGAIYEGETPPPFGTQYSGGFKAVRSTQRANTQYATIPLNRTQRQKQSFFKSFLAHLSTKCSGAQGELL